MALQILKEFKALTKSSQEIIVCAEKLSDAALALESDTVELHQVTVLRDAVQVDVPVSKVRFNVSISPTAAETAGCVALPKTYIVDVGGKVILQAVESVGYVFAGWFRGAVLVSDDLVAEVAIVAPAAPDTADEIVATFTLT